MTDQNMYRIAYLDNQDAPLFSEAIDAGTHGVISNDIKQYAEKRAAENKNVKRILIVLDRCVVGGVPMTWISPYSAALSARVDVKTMHEEFFSK